MKVGLIDVDGHHFPNLALMKLSAGGDTAAEEWYTNRVPFLLFWTAQWEYGKN